KIKLLEAKVTNTTSRKKKAVILDPNIKFIIIIELEASKVKSNIDKSAVLDLPSKAKSCIIIALKGY
ncbi:hypothetical protein LX32DRAFT_589309, partial [Colletotrichum zoysiae]